MTDLYTALHALLEQATATEQQQREKIDVLKDVLREARAMINSLHKHDATNLLTVCHVQGSVSEFEFGRAVALLAKIDRLLIEA